MGERRDIEFVARSLLRSDLEKFQSSHCGSAQRGLKDQILSQSCSRYTASISSPVPFFVPRKPFQTPKAQKQTPPSQPRHSGVTATREAQKAASSSSPRSRALSMASHSSPRRRRRSDSIMDSWYRDPAAARSRPRDSGGFQTRTFVDFSPLVVFFCFCFCFC